MTTYAGRRERALSNDSTERLGILAHELRNLLNSAMLSFGSIKKGVVAPGGSTSLMLERNLIGLQNLVDRSLADVRLDAGLQLKERILVAELVEEVAIGAALVARSRDLFLKVGPIDPTLTVKADRQVLAAAISNILQNALKFTKLRSTVAMRVFTHGGRVLIGVEDECGGLPDGAAETLLVPFVQKGSDRTGLGLGLTICLKAMKAVGGELRIQDIPGRGCIFTLDLPQAPSG